uniref:Uncharacterized protein n=1 Tax=Pseudo-nitzschia australis TaxID=44445 RepID=A0A6U9ZK56_9STRA|mmetsp:Transcript_10068/g.21310  ORF Transcript_10068/g.21310 Transcript_10068/m.21310 type:complete len:403 (-) Transcript_10068:898-2106(-)
MESLSGFGNAIVDYYHRKRDCSGNGVSVGPTIHNSREKVHKNAQCYRHQQRQRHQQTSPRNGSSSSSSSVRHNYDGKKHIGRQNSDKHLKRRSQLLAMQQQQQQQQQDDDYYGMIRNASSDPLSCDNYHTITRTTTHNNNHHHHRHPRRSLFFFFLFGRGDDKKNDTIPIKTTISTTTSATTRIIFVLVLFLAATMISWTLRLPLPWTITITGSMSSNSNNNNNNNHNNNINNGINGNNGNDNGHNKLRSYQDLADSIRQVRIRRQELKDIAAQREDEDVHAANDNGEDTNRKNRSYNNKELASIAAGASEDQEAIRLQVLEQKIQLDQNRRVRQEFLLTHHNNNGDAATAIKTVNTIESASTNADEKSGSEPLDSEADQDQLISESIAQLKALQRQTIGLD